MITKRLKRIHYTIHILLSLLTYFHWMLTEFRTLSGGWRVTGPGAGWHRPLCPRVRPLCNYWPQSTPPCPLLTPQATLGQTLDAIHPNIGERKNRVYVVEWSISQPTKVSLSVKQQRKRDTITLGQEQNWLPFFFKEYKSWYCFVTVIKRIHK